MNNKAFTKKSLKRYKAIRRLLKRVPAPEGVVYIPGRLRLHGVVSDVVYVDVWDTKTGGRDRFFFNHTPKESDLRLALTIISCALRMGEHIVLFTNKGTNDENSRYGISDINC